MTLHVRYSHQCPNCDAHFIPYDSDVLCPNCGQPPDIDDVFPFIGRAAASVNFNLASYGSYVPPAWYIGSLGDHFLYILFGLFEAYRQAGRPADFPEFSAMYLNRPNWGDQAYLRDHIGAIAHAVLPFLKPEQKPPDEEDGP